jgi:hypothetical protein
MWKKINILNVSEQQIVIKTKQLSASKNLYDTENEL